MTSAYDAPLVPGIREACSHWRDAPMLQPNLEALAQRLDQNNNACIDCAKTTVEVVCRVIVMCCR